MDKWLKDILPDKEPHHNRGRDQMRKIRVPVVNVGIIIINGIYIAY
jgi:hypothetical protein